MKEVENIIIQESLKNADRFEDIINLIESLHVEFNKDKNVICDRHGRNVSANSLLKPLGEVLLYISGFKTEVSDNMDDLRGYIESKLDIDLHNYTNSLSHRHVPRIRLDFIRIEQILLSIIDNINDNEYGKFYIPSGWAKYEPNTELLTEEIYQDILYKFADWCYMNGIDFGHMGKADDEPYAFNKSVITKYLKEDN